MSADSNEQCEYHADPTRGTDWSPKVIGADGSRKVLTLTKVTAALHLLLIRATVVGLTVVACFVLLEIGLRILDRPPSNATDGFFVQYGDSYRLRPNLNKIVRWPAYEYVAYTDQHGYRSPQPGPRTIGDSSYVVFMGASQTFGNGVDFEDSFVGVVSANLEEESVRSVNLAVGGHHLIDQFDLLKDAKSSLRQPPSVVFVCMNPLMISKFDEGQNNIMVKSGYLFDADNWFVPYVRVMLGNLSASYTFLRDSIRNIQGANSSGEHPVNTAYLELYGPDHRFKQQSTVQELYGQIDEVIAYIRSLGARPVLAYVPTVGSTTVRKMASEAGLDPAAYQPRFYGNLLSEYAEARGLTMINPHNLLFRNHELGQALSFRLDAHYNHFTNALVGNHIIEELRKGDVLPTILAAR